jgi:hypothetical protein
MIEAEKYNGCCGKIEPYGYIYLILDQKYNKVYVGQSTNFKGKETYLGSGKIIIRIRKLRGAFFLKKTILGVCYSKETLDECEIECISFFNSKNSVYGYNVTNGGSSGRGRIKSIEERKHHSLVMKGKRHSEKTKELLRQLSTGKNNPMFGKHLSLSEERKKSISKRHKGKVLSEETKNKISISATGRKKSQEEKAKQSKTRIGKFIGEKAGRVKLTEKQVKDIILQLQLKNLSINQLSIKYKVTRSCIEGIKSKRTWKHISLI